MKIPLTSISAGGLMLMTLSSLGLAQGAPPSPLSAAPPAPQAAVYDPQQLPAIRGELDRLTLTVRGDIDGFILKDGTEVNPRRICQRRSRLQSGRVIGSPYTD